MPEQVGEPVPKVIRSRRDLVERGLAEPLVAQIPVRQGGTTYEMAQETRWLDPSHFAVGRWDGSMSVFEFQTAGTQGPVITEAVNGPSSRGVQMVAPLPGAVIATSNSANSLVLWIARGGNWAQLEPLALSSYPGGLGDATAGVAVPGSPSHLVVGHQTGYVSIWNQPKPGGGVSFERFVDVRNPNPVNPFDDHVIEDVVIASTTAGVVAVGSEDGFVTMLSIPSGTILSQTVFNPKAQRGINAVAISGQRLLVANCSVGPEDSNLWFFAINPSTWQISLLDKARLVINQGAPQVFNFDVEWGQFPNGCGPCWVASTEEGALWMGAPAGNSLGTIGYQQLTGPLGSALAVESGQRLAMVAYDLYQFTLGS
jgi:hypothetical protein